MPACRRRRSGTPRGSGGRRTSTPGSRASRRRSDECVFHVTPGVGGVTTSHACLDPAWLQARGAVGTASVEGVTWRRKPGLALGQAPVGALAASSLLAFSDRSAVVGAWITALVGCALEEDGRGLELVERSREAQPSLPSLLTPAIAEMPGLRCLSPLGVPPGVGDQIRLGWCRTPAKGRQRRASKLDLGKEKKPAKRHKTRPPTAGKGLIRIDRSYSRLADELTRLGAARSNHGLVRSLGDPAFALVGSRPIRSGAASAAALKLQGAPHSSRAGSPRCTVPPRTTDA